MNLGILFDGTREENIEKYRAYFKNRISNDPEFRAKILSLKGKTLGCFCIPKPCHGNVIVEYLGTAPDGPQKYAVVGSRTFDDYNYLESILKWYNASCIISGGARGADQLARRYAIEHKIKLVEFIPNWDKYGKKAGFIRNRQIVDACDCVIAFWDKKSKGTKSTIQIATEQSKEVFIFWPPNVVDILENFG